MNRAAIHAAVLRDRAGIRLAPGVLLLFFLSAAPARANAGVPIAPVVGVQLWLYFPLLLLQEAVVVRRRFRSPWRAVFRWVLRWNAVSTLAGFTGLLLAIYGAIACFGFTLLAVDRMFRTGGVQGWIEFLNITNWPGFGTLNGILYVILYAYWAGPPVEGPGKVPISWYVFYFSCILFWTVVAFVVSVGIEEWVACREPGLAKWGREEIHRTVLLANVVSYVPLVLANVGWMLHTVVRP